MGVALLSVSLARGLEPGARLVADGGWRGGLGRAEGGGSRPRRAAGTGPKGERAGSRPHSWLGWFRLALCSSANWLAVTWASPSGPCNARLSWQWCPGPRHSGAREPAGRMRAQNLLPGRSAEPARHDPGPRPRGPSEARQPSPCWGTLCGQSAHDQVASCPRRLCPFLNALQLDDDGPASPLPSSPPPGPCAAGAAQLLPHLLPPARSPGLREAQAHTQPCPLLAAPSGRGSPGRRAPVRRGWCGTKRGGDLRLPTGTPENSESWNRSCPHPCWESPGLQACGATSATLWSLSEGPDGVLSILIRAICGVVAIKKKFLLNEQMHVGSELKALGCFKYYVRRVGVNKPDF